MYAKTGARAQPQELVEQHGPLVRRIAHHLLARLPSSVSVEDLIQSGMIGLLEAAASYRPDARCQLRDLRGHPHPWRDDRRGAPRRLVATLGAP
jgi:DNA-directed RNA polymerase sigma subunit (sigma70/sigma32)